MAKSISVGWLIFYKSLVQLVSYFFRALWHSGIAILFLVSINALFFLVIGWGLNRTGPLTGVLVEFIGVFIALSILLTIPLWNFIGYKWMRFMLAKQRGQNLSEMQPGFWPYFKFSMLLILTIFFVVAVPVLVLLYLLSLLPTIEFNQIWLLGFAAVAGTLFVTYLYLRLSLVLPAVAMGSWMTFGDSFAETSKFSGAIAIIVVLEFCFVGGVTYLIELLNSETKIYLVLTAVFYWFNAMLWICIITTLFAYIVNSSNEPIPEAEAA